MTIMLRNSLLLCILLLAIPLFAQPPKTENPWAPLAFLMGEWTGEGSGQPGQGSGGFSFLPDLEKNVLVRKNRADYPATKDRLAFSHTDLMIVYREPGAIKLRAIYFDSEGHVIHYTVDPSADGDAVQFLSDASNTNPRYRLTYTKTGADAVGIQFEIAVPGKPDSFSTYIQATARRKSR
jgi:hypothetical protein